MVDLPRRNGEADQTAQIQIGITNYGDRGAAIEKIYGNLTGLGPDHPIRNRSARTAGRQWTQCPSNGVEWSNSFVPIKVMKMKQAATSDPVSDFNKVTLDKILAIEKDVVALKLSVLKKLGPTRSKIVKLKGIVPNVEITDEDIAFAKASLYGNTRI